MLRGMKHHHDTSILDTLTRVLAAAPDISAANLPGVIAAVKALYDPDGSPYAHLANVDFDTPAVRAQVSWALTLARAQQIVERDGLEPLFLSAPKAATPAPPRLRRCRIRRSYRARRCESTRPIG